MRHVFSVAAALAKQMLHPIKSIYLSLGHTEFNHETYEVAFLFFGPVTFFGTLFRSMVGVGTVYMAVNTATAKLGMAGKEEK